MHDGWCTHFLRWSAMSGPNPAQLEVIDLLGRRPDDVLVAHEAVAELAACLDEELADLAEEIDPQRPVFVSKHSLTTIHGCEAHHLASQQGFEWTVANARGTVAHKAIEVLLNWRGEPYPSVLVDEAIARAIDSDDRSGSLGGFLASLGEYERAELRAEVIGQVAAFQDGFPPLEMKWRPVVESRLRVDLFGGRIVLQGKTDLTLGRAPHKVIIDLKTGRPNASHREDLRFYALVETLRLGAAPRKVASFYLETCRAHPEAVSEAMLRSALRRTVDGIRRMVEIGPGGRTPTRRPGPQCRWCPLLPTCEEGAAARERAADGNGDEPW